MKPIVESTKTVNTNEISFPRGIIGNGRHTWTEIFLKKGRKMKKISPHRTEMNSNINQGRDFWNPKNLQPGLYRVETITRKDRGRSTGIVRQLIVGENGEYKLEN